MSLTSYRAAPPRGGAVADAGPRPFGGRAWRVRRRPTLPRLKAQYHRRRGLSRPSSEWDRVRSPPPWPPNPPSPPAGGGRGRAKRCRAPAAPVPGPALVGACLWARRAAARIKPNERLVPVGCARRRASTPGLSTWSSTTALRGDLVSRGASRLDAFSGYPGRT